VNHRIGLGNYASEPMRMQPFSRISLCLALSGAPLSCTDTVDPEPQAESGSTTGVGASTGHGSDGTAGESASSAAEASTTGTTEASTGAAESSTSSGTNWTDDGPVPNSPGDQLDLSYWKLTLPTGSDEEPDEILQPELAEFEQPPHFWLDDTSSVVFRAEVDGVTTSGSSYPRSELREMTPGGRDEAAWSTSEGRHVMTIRQAITALPPGKPHVVAGQIHDADDDLVMIRLEESHLFVEGDGDELGTLDPDYVLGTEFTVRIVAEGGTIDVYYDDLTTPAVTVPREAEGCYFKAGAYTQSNLEYDEADAFGEVAIRELEVEHR
jgi:hypothetical protein